jgi:hypothetical protein
MSRQGRVVWIRERDPIDIPDGWHIVGVAATKQVPTGIGTSVQEHVLVVLESDENEPSEARARR